MKNLYLLFKVVSVIVLWLLALVVMCILLLFQVMLLEVKDFIPAGVCAVGIIGYVFCGVRVFKGQKVVVSGGMMLLFAVLSDAALFWSASGWSPDYEADCADMGVCSEKVISEKECSDGEGIWRTVGGERLCYLKWSTVRPAVEAEMAGGVEAQDKRLIASVDELAGRHVLYSSPYLRGDEAVMIEVKQAQLSDDFVDDGLIVLNGKKYPLDQIFMQNNEGRFENLASLYAYNGVAGTFLLHYYDKERLAVAEEKAKMLADVDRCVQPFEGGGADNVYHESRAQSECIDKVFERFVKMFYSFSENKILADYWAMVRQMKLSFEELAVADSCYGRCGTAAMMSAGGKAVELQTVFVREAIETLDVGE